MLDFKVGTSSIIYCIKQKPCQSCILKVEEKIVKVVEVLS